MFPISKYRIAGLFFLFFSHSLYSSTISAELFSSDGSPVGEVIFEDSTYGLLIKPNLYGLPPGSHGFHIHQNPDCGEKGMKAGGHLDPRSSSKHQGPYYEGHLGDLPVLFIDENGKNNTPSLAPRLISQDIRGHSIIIHAGSDNYSDIPPLGGGGARIACGKIPA